MILGAVTDHAYEAQLVNVKDISWQNLWQSNAENQPLC
jgi:hypothetical protein